MYDETGGEGSIDPVLIVGIEIEVHRLARPLGNFLIARPWTLAWGGAAPIVNNVPPDEVEGAICVGALKGELGADEPNPVFALPNVTGVVAWGKLVLPVAGDAG